LGLGAEDACDVEGGREKLFGREDVSGHGFNRAAKLLTMNNSALPKACAERSEVHEINVFQPCRKALIQKPAANQNDPRPTVAAILAIISTMCRLSTQEGP
jgi:hypothetical protein